VGGFVKALPTAPIITSRGCPFKCKYCAASLSGGTIRFRSPESVVDEMAYLVKEHGVREIHLLDDNFTLHRNHALAVCDGILRRGLKLALALPNGVRIDTLDVELIGILQRAGCYSLTLGIDSGSQRILDAMNRQISLEEMETRIRMIKATSSIRITGNFILGFPTETADDIQKTIAFARRVPLDRAYFAFFLPLPGSELFNTLREAGRLDALDYRLLSERARTPAFVPSTFTKGQLRRMLLKAYLRFYGRSGILMRLLGEIQGPNHLLGLAQRAFARLVGVKNDSGPSHPISCPIGSAHETEAGYSGGKSMSTTPS
jgi:radical SAM superfamily enzyme YgiQ (UPF0313 family)